MIIDTRWHDIFVIEFVTARFPTTSYGLLSALAISILYGICVPAGLRMSLGEHYNNRHVRAYRSRFVFDVVAAIHIYGRLT